MATIAEFAEASERVERWLMDWPCFLCLREDGEPLPYEILQHAEAANWLFGEFGDAIIAASGGSSGELVEIGSDGDGWFPKLIGSTAHEVAGLWAWNVAGSIERATDGRVLQEQLLRAQRPFCDDVACHRLSLLVKRERALLVANGDNPARQSRTDDSRYGYLDLFVHPVTGNVWRKGHNHGHPVSLDPGSAELHTLLVAWKAKEAGATPAEWKDSYPATATPGAMRAVKSRLNQKLRVLAVKLESDIPPKLSEIFPA